MKGNKLRRRSGTLKINIISNVLLAFLILMIATQNTSVNDLFSKNVLTFQVTYITSPSHTETILSETVPDTVSAQTVPLTKELHLYLLLCE